MQKYLVNTWDGQRVKENRKEGLCEGKNDIFWKSRQIGGNISQPLAVESSVFNQLLYYH